MDLLSRRCSGKGTCRENGRSVAHALEPSLSVYPAVMANGRLGVVPGSSRKGGGGRCASSVRREANVGNDGPPGERAAAGYAGKVNSEKRIRNVRRSRMMRNDEDEVSRKDEGHEVQTNT